LIPLKIKTVKNNDLLIDWDDGSKSSIDFVTLRKNCPCAVCMAEKEEHGDTYIPIYTKDQLTLKSIKQMGNYALGIDWKDGHNTGIFVFDYLYKLSKITES